LVEESGTGHGRGGRIRRGRARRSASRRDAGQMRRGYALSGRAARWGFIAPVVIFIGAFFVYPLVENVIISLQNYSAASFYTGRAPFVGFANYSAVFHDPELFKTVRNTVIFTFGSIAIQFAIGLALAVFFSRRFPLNAVLRSLLLLPWLLPLVVSGTVFRWMFSQENGVIDQALTNLHLASSPVPWLSSPGWALVGVIMVNIWVGIPFNMVILYGGLQAIPRPLYEAAALEGASAWSQFRYISLPLLRPVTTVVLTLGFIYTIKVFDVIMVVTQGGPALATQTLTIWAYNLSFINFNFGEGAAVGNLLVVVAFVFALFYLRGVGRGSGEVVT
jgi:multiple sugar transport system permease protein